MKKFIITMFLSFFATSAIAAINCKSRPDCVDLGYNKTAAQCAGRSVMKCPWDTTQMYCSLSTPTCDDGKTYVDGEGCKDGITYCATKGQTFYEESGCGNCPGDQVFDNNNKECVDGITYCNAQWKRFNNSTCEACSSGQVVEHHNSCVPGIDYCTNEWLVGGDHTEGIYNADAQKCEKCPEGKFGDKAQNACKSPGEQCGDASENKIYKDDGTCTCDAEYNEDASGNCIICETGQLFDSSSKSCVNGDDYCYSKGQTFIQGECRPCSEGKFVEQPGPQCTQCNGYVKNATTCILEGEQCDEHKVATADGQCVCDASNNYMDDPSDTGYCTKCNGYLKDATTCKLAGEQCDDNDEHKVATADGECKCDTANDFIVGNYNMECVYGPNFCASSNQEYNSETHTCKPCSDNQHFDSEKKKCICDDGLFDLGDGACGLPVDGFDYDDIVNYFPGLVSGLETDCRCRLSGGCCNGSQLTELCCRCDANGIVEGCPIIIAPPSGGTVVVP